MSSAVLADWLDHVHHGDALELMQRLPDGCVDLLVTDPPYSVTITSSTVHRPGRDRLVEHDWAEDFAWVGEVARLLNPAGCWYVFMNDEGWSGLRREAVRVGWRPLARLVWVKTNPLPSFRGRNYRGGTELCQFGAASATERYWFRPYASQRDALSVWHLPIVGGNERTEHPTQKPLSMMRDFVRNSCPPGGTVFDPFAGSGTSLVAAALEGRHFIGFEIDERYCAIAQKRVADALAQPMLDMQEVVQ